MYRQLDADLFVAYAPEPHWEPLREIFPFARGFLEQQGADLGQRMDNALPLGCLRGGMRLCADRSDLPLLGKAHFEAAFAALEGAGPRHRPVAGRRILLDWDEAPLHRNF